MPGESGSGRSSAEAPRLRRICRRMSSTQGSPSASCRRNRWHRRDRARRERILYSGCVPPSEFGGPWPESVPLQIHMKDADPWGEEDRPAAEALVKEVEDAELFVYPGSGHIFTEPDLADYDAQAAGLLMERTLAFLDRVG